VAYRGRFAPSPTGPLHAGSLVAALASWLDARVHGGTWLVRIEDIDTPRCEPAAADFILHQLSACGLHPDQASWLQSTRGTAYGQALQQLQGQGRAYACGCTRKDIDEALAAAGKPHHRFGERVYPGTCRSGLHGKPARAVRLRVEGVVNAHADGMVDWHDRRLGAQRQDVAAEVGDFVLRRADGLWAYQLAVVVDDAAQGITHVVRGQDLADNTARQILLQRALAVATPAYLHTPLVLAADGHKLSKQNGAQALDLRDPAQALRQALAVLGLTGVHAADVPALLAAGVQAWAARWPADTRAT
jgi:glutamyl-Q tRNA(Asp) synthetase